MFASWSRNPDLALADSDDFLKLLREHTQHFTPLLQAALDERVPNPFMLPHQHEFNRLNLSYVVTSKRKLMQLVAEKHVDGWDDPRMPTLVGLRRRGFTPQSIQLFMERIGVSKSMQWIDYALLEQALRDDLDARAPRATAVLDPIRLVIDNWPAEYSEDCVFQVHPHRPELGTRTLPMARELGPAGIHVAHTIIDGAIDTEFIRTQFPQRYALKEEGGILNPDHIADAYWMLHQQPRDAWTHELDLRPYMEKF
jgi:glutaminyl-tRNA synthetase